jgi:hypothetical protein
MRLSEFEELIATFSTRPRPGRHVYLWHGNEIELRAKLPPRIIQSLDIVDRTASTQPLASAPSEAAEQLRRLIVQELQDLRSKLTSPIILAVTGCHLLARYRTGIGMFFQYYVSDGAMVIFSVPEQGSPIPNLPSYVEFEPQAVSEYLARLIGRENVIQGGNHDASTTNSHR